MRQLLTSKEKWYCFVCKCLGAKQFKKYWFVGGSVWNKHHINKDNQKDLERVIEDSWEYTRTHLQGLFLEFVIYFVGYFTGLVLPHQFWGILPIFALLHGYPLLIHHYNRILAQNRIKQLPNILGNDVLKNLVNKSTPLCLYIDNNEDSLLDSVPTLYKLRSVMYDVVGPYFSSYEEADSYYKFFIKALDLIDDEKERTNNYCKISHAIFIKYIETVYIQWCKLEHKNCYINQDTSEHGGGI